MNTSLIGALAFAAIALVAWGIAELKDTYCKYVQNDEEKAVDERNAQLLHSNGYNEMNIADVIKNISTKGFDAV